MEFNSQDYLKSLLDVIQTINNDSHKEMTRDPHYSKIYGSVLENIEMIEDLIENYKREAKKERMLEAPI